jgi:hypothetical protein
MNKTEILTEIRCSLPKTPLPQNGGSFKICRLKQVLCSSFLARTLTDEGCTGEEPDKRLKKRTKMDRQADK